MSLNNPKRLRHGDHGQRSRKEARHGERRMAAAERRRTLDAAYATCRSCDARLLAASGGSLAHYEDGSHGYDPEGSPV